MKKAKLQLGKLGCSSCQQKIAKALKMTPGIREESVEVILKSSKVELDFDEELVTLAKISEVIKELGYEVKKTKVK